jgi:hypothetical protein
MSHEITGVRHSQTWNTFVVTVKVGQRKIVTLVKAGDRNDPTEPKVSVNEVDRRLASFT